MISDNLILFFIWTGIVASGFVLGLLGFGVIAMCRNWIRGRKG